MRAQSQIQRTLGETATRERIAAILSRKQFASRRAGGRRICAEFDFRDRREHRQGLGTFAGAQMRYLVHSAHGYLGAPGFAAAAGASGFGGVPEPVPDPAGLREPGQPCAGAGAAVLAAGLPGALRLQSVAGGDLR